MDTRGLPADSSGRGSTPPQHQASAVGRTLVPALLGVAIDVSGSMQQSIRNDAAADLSRLDGVGRGFDALLAGSRRLAQAHGGQAGFPLRIFAYAFGVGFDPHYADLLAILKFARSMHDDKDFGAYLEQSKNDRRLAAEREGEAMRNQASRKYGGLADAARSWGFGSAVDSYTQRAEADARRRLTQEAEDGVRQDVIAYVRERIGDTTLPVDELAALWGEGDGTFRDVRQYIFGSTPMCACLREVALRFGREKAAAAGANEDRLLLLISDGEPTDGDPRRLAEEIRDSGVDVACVFVTNHDVHAPRDLVGGPQPDWPPGASLLFDMATPVESAANGLTAASADWRTILANSGWTVSPGARLFIQANHSEALADFMRIVATAFPARQVLQAMRRTT